jgi:tripartite-type tricarboxylate transporter receptor subunit TctC
MAPAGTPAPIVARLHLEIAKSLASAEMQAAMATEGADAVGNKPQEFAAFIKSEIDKWGKVVKTARIEQD